MLFDRVYNTVLESNEIKNEFELITPKKYSHAIVANYFCGFYELYEVGMAKHAGEKDKVPFFNRTEIYEGPIPPESYIKASITTGRDIMDLYNTNSDNTLIPSSYYIIKNSAAKLQKIYGIAVYEAYLKPAESAFDYTSNDTEDVFKDFTDAL